MKKLGFVMGPINGAVQVIAALPRVVDAVLVLPELSRQLARVGADTESLPSILAELRSVQGDTKALPGIKAELEAMQAALAQVETQTADLERLVEVIVPLTGAAARVGRFADRLPQRRFSNGNGNGNGRAAGLAPEGDTAHN
jgi:hypothetical protein